jgi:hypothetical protein
MSSTSVFEEGQSIPHEMMHAAAGGTIPADVARSTAPVGEEQRVACAECDDRSPSTAFEWIDTRAEVTNVDEDGAVEDRDVHSVTLRCPCCAEQFTTYQTARLSH